MVDLSEIVATRKHIAIRLLFSILFLFVFGILETIIWLIVLFQYIMLFITRKPNLPVRNFSNQLITYAYRVMRYLTLNENTRPFPFNDFPAAIDPPEDPVTFQ